MMQQDFLNASPAPLPKGFDLLPDYLSPNQASLLMARLLCDLPWECPEVSFWGKSHPMPRNVFWQGDPGAGYRYSGLYREPSAWHPWVGRLRNKLQDDTGYTFNSVLANLYRDGKDKVGWHADDEPELGSQPIIASISLGAERDFRIRRKDRSPIKHSATAMNIRLPAGSLLIMDAGVQASWEHCVPVRSGITQARINLTFRKVASLESQRALSK